jgi:hypothetical protein
MLTVVAALTAPLGIVRGEGGVSAAGHWEGAIVVPSGEMPFEVDLAVDGNGALVGTFTNPSERLVGYPLSKASVDGGSITLEIDTGADSGPQRFVGKLSADGQAMSGELLVSVYGLPFNFRRTGAAEIQAPPRSPAIDAALARDWHATLAIGGSSLPVRLSLRNNADGTASGSWASGRGVATPVKIVHENGRLILTSAAAPASFVGAVSADGAEIAGTLKSGALEQALTFTQGASAR